MKLSMLTTVDNPHDPFDDFDNWYAWDERSGYHTTAFLARVCVMSDDLSDLDQALAIEYAIDEIMNQNVTGNFRRVTREFPDGSI